jgi:hypothetical protein
VAKSSKGGFGGGGRGGRIVVRGSFVEVQGRGISTRFDVGGALLVARSGQRDSVSLLKRFSPAVLRKTKAHINIGGGDPRVLNVLNKALGR